MQAGGTRSGRLIHWMEEDYVQVAKEAPACKYVMPELGNEVQARSLFNSGTISTVGSLPPFTEIRSITVAQGRFYNYEDRSEEHTSELQSLAYLVCRLLLEKKKKKRKKEQTLTIAICISIISNYSTV